MDALLILMLRITEVDFIVTDPLGFIKYKMVNEVGNSKIIVKIAKSKSQNKNQNSVNPFSAKS